MEGGMEGGVEGGVEDGRGLAITKDRGWTAGPAGEGNGGGEETGGVYSAGQE